MTPATVDLSTPRPKGAEPSTIAESFIQGFELAAEWRDALRWPSPRYREDPVGFAIDILGIEPWAKQIEILLAIRDSKRVAIRSGHKCGKSNSCAICALWFFASFEDARVVMTCVTARQVNAILYREVRKLHARSGTCFSCRKQVEAANAIRAKEKRPALPMPRPCPHSTILDGEAHEVAHSGIKTLDQREITGFTAKEPEAVAGISGANILYLVDEASGVPAVIYEAIQGNLAGGGRLALISNPTKTTGEFAEAFTKKAHIYTCIHISSEDSPNVKAGREVIPGLATREWVEEKAREWGKESPLYRVRVLGEFVLDDEMRIVTVDRLTGALARWENAVDDMGRLCIGIDPAGSSGTGDESVFAIRRGAKCLALVAKRGLTHDAHLVHLLGLLTVHHNPRHPKPLVVVDGDGAVNGRVAGALQTHLDKHPDAFELVVVYASELAQRDPRGYERVRDELWASLANWLAPIEEGGAGGAIPSDSKLEAELAAPEWRLLPDGRLKATPKSELREVLDRSPDRADALALSTWEPTVFETRGQRHQSHRDAIDPYTVDGHGDGDPVYGAGDDGDSDPVYGGPRGGTYS